jgi:hypothetical protein
MTNSPDRPNRKLWRVLLITLVVVIPVGGVLFWTTHKLTHEMNLMGAAITAPAAQPAS